MTILNTTKKVKIIGYQDYINSDTGEIETMQVINFEERDFNFHNIWLTHIVQSLELIGNQKVKLVMFLFENMDYENKACLSQRQMVDRSKISLETVRTTLKILSKAQFIKSINMGVYQINSDFIYKSGKSNRMNVLFQYNQISNENKEQK